MTIIQNMQYGEELLLEDNIYVNVCPSQVLT